MQNVLSNRVREGVGTVGAGCWKTGFCGARRSTGTDSSSHSPLQHRPCYPSRCSRKQEAQCRWLNQGHRCSVEPEHSNHVFLPLKPFAPLSSPNLARWSGEASVALTRGRPGPCQVPRRCASPESGWVNVALGSDAGERPFLGSRQLWAVHARCLPFLPHSCEESSLPHFPAL